MDVLFSELGKLLLFSLGVIFLILVPIVVAGIAVFLFDLFSAPKIKDYAKVIGKSFVSGEKKIIWTTWVLPMLVNCIDEWYVSLEIEGQKYILSTNQSLYDQLSAGQTVEVEYRKSRWLKQIYGIYVTAIRT